MRWAIQSPGPVCAGLAAIAVATGWSQSFAQGNLPLAEAFDKGRQQYHRTCAQCHGRNLVNSGTTVYDLRRFPDDQRDRFVQSVTKGKGNMPGFEGALDAMQMEVLWTYVSRRGKPPD